MVARAARAHELDRYLAALLAPAGVRADLIALAAFAGEIARVPAFVSEPMLGEIRLQWWRDTLDAIAAAGASSGNPIADAVGDAVRRHALPMELLHGLIDAHAARLIDAPFADLPALSANLAHTDGALFALGWRILGGAREDAEPGLIAAGAQAYGLARLLVELPVTLSHGKILLPLDRLAAHGLTPDEVRQDTGGDRLARVLAELAGRARQHADEIRRDWRALSPAARAALRPLALVRPYLRLSERRSSSVYEVADVAPLTRVWRLWRIGHSGAV